MHLQSQPYPDYIHSLMLNKREEKFVHTLNDTYWQILSLYRKDAYKFKIKTPQDRSPFVEMVNMITKKALLTQNPKIIYFGNYFVNELQCDFSVADHEEKFAPVFKSAHHQIDSFLINVQGSTIKQMIVDSNKKCEHYLSSF
jgi:hypothetical protein